MPAILTIYVGEANSPKAVVVADALYCGVCKPQPEVQPQHVGTRKEDDL